jgi:hypothetical protein
MFPNLATLIALSTISFSSAHWDHCYLFGLHCPVLLLRKCFQVEWQDSCSNPFLSKITALWCLLSMVWRELLTHFAQFCSFCVGRVSLLLIALSWPEPKVSLGLFSNMSLPVLWGEYCVFIFLRWYWEHFYCSSNFLPFPLLCIQLLLFLIILNRNDCILACLQTGILEATEKFYTAVNRHILKSYLSGSKRELRIWSI